LTHAAIYDYRLEPGDIDIIIALDTPQFMIIEPGDIDIIALTHAEFMIIAWNLVISLLLSLTCTPQFMIIALTSW
jgi:hypothetical protein